MLSKFYINFAKQYYELFYFPSLGTQEKRILAYYWSRTTDLITHPVCMLSSKHYVLHRKKYGLVNMFLQFYVFSISVAGGKVVCFNLKL